MASYGCPVWLFSLCISGGSTTAVEAGGFQQAESELLALAPWVSGGDDEMYHASMDSTELH